MWTILVSDCDQLEANAVARDDVADRAFSANLTFLDEKIKFNCQAQRAPVQGFQEEAGDAEIANA